MTVFNAETKINDAVVSLETGKVARQAAGAVTIRIGDTMILTTVCSGPPREGINFFPLTVEYIAKGYATGKIPGGFIKREGRPRDSEVLAARLVDRPIRPLFPEGYKDEVQIINTVISADEKYNADVLAITAASCALTLSDLPFNEPVAGVRVGIVDGEFKAFPTMEESAENSLDIIVAGTENSIMMVEGGAEEVSEDKLIEAITFAHSVIKDIVAIQKELKEKAGKEKQEFTPPEEINPELVEEVKSLAGDRLHELSFNGDKDARYKGLSDLTDEIIEKLSEKYPEQEGDIKKVIHDMEYEDMRSTILKEGKRIGDRGLDQIREISCELDFVPRAHGSALFTRGETQSLGVATLGSKKDEQIIDDIQEDYKKTYMLHYNFPPFSVGEVKRLGSVSRREVGHGHLAERALSPVLPNEESFPYTIRLVSEVLESNGSSSMASVCSGSMALMAAGVPVKCLVSGVAMGLISDGENVAILTDILGTEDHMGDMDFKVTGTTEGITAIQMDIKIDGITSELMKKALEKAKAARLSILDTMSQAISEPRSATSSYAPEIVRLQIDNKKIGDVIGPGGKTIREMQERYECDINIDDDGVVVISSEVSGNASNAKKEIEKLTESPKLNKVYTATIKSVVDFGAFAEFLPKRDGLIHISEIADEHVKNVTDYVNEGDVVKVKLIGFERDGKVRLTMKGVDQD